MQQLMELLGMSGQQSSSARPDYASKLQGAMSPQYPGMLSPGNIDLGNRPLVKNKNGTTSTVRSIGIDMDGKHVLIPTVSEDGRIMSNQEAIDQFRKTRKHLGIFDNEENGTNYAKQLHNQQAELYRDKIR